MAPCMNDLCMKPCYYCGFESTTFKFKYFDNKKCDQPRYQCPNCSKLFTGGFHERTRARGKTYTKKRNQDPEELRGLDRQCPHCGAANDAVFKYYNNRSLSQPRFKCLSCKLQFQMHLVGEGNERCLLHTVTKQKRKKKTKPC